MNTVQRFLGQAVACQACGREHRVGVREALLIDDDPQICEAVGNILESLGHTYVRAGSQEEARAVLSDAPYAYVLLDLEILWPDGQIQRMDQVRPDTLVIATYEAAG